jgi:MFS family permease
MGIFSVFADKVVRVVKYVGILTALTSVFHLFITGIILFAAGDIKLTVMLVMINAVYLNIIFGIRGVISFKTCYYILDVKDFPRVMGVAGAIANIASIAISTLFSILCAVFPYREIIVTALLVSAVLSVVSGFTTISFKILSTAQHSSTKTSLVSVLKHKATYTLLVPNFIRGISSGIFALAAVIMLSTVTENTALSSLLHTVYVVAATLSCFAFAFLTRRMSCPTIMLIGSIIFLPAVIFMTLFSEIGFMIFYFVATVGIVLVDYSIPAYVVQIVPSDIMARYSSVRMFSFNAGVSVGSALVGVFLSHGAALWLLVTAGVVLLITCSSYFLFGFLNSPKKD